MWRRHHARVEGWSSCCFSSWLVFFFLPLTCLKFEKTIFSFLKTLIRKSYCLRDWLNYLCSILFGFFVWLFWSCSKLYPTVLDFVGSILCLEEISKIRFWWEYVFEPHEECILMPSVVGRMIGMQFFIFYFCRFVYLRFDYVTLILFFVSFWSREILFKEWTWSWIFHHSLV